MEELKTLKEIPLNILGDDPEDDSEHWAKRELLGQIRQEAIKHLKQIKVTKIKDDSDMANAGAYVWIKHFFNITSEDLK